MISVHRPERGEPEPVPEAGPPLPGSREADDTRARLEPRDDSHLLPCRHCGVLNGRSAVVCWGCETDLLVTGAFSSRAAPAPAPAPGPVARPEPPRAPPSARAELPVLHVEPRHGLRLVAHNEAPARVSAAAPFDPEATVPVLVSQGAARAQMVDLSLPLPLPLPNPAEAVDVALPDLPDAASHRLKWIAAAVAVLLVVFGVYIQSGSPSPAGAGPAAAPAAGFTQPEPAVITNPDAPVAAAVPVTRPPAAARSKPSGTTSNAGPNTKRAAKARAGTPPRVQAATVAASANPAPVADRAEPARLPIWPPYPCTPTVAATGLCTMESAPAKP